MSRYEARRHDDEVELPRTTTAVMELPKLLDPEEPVEVTTCADGGQSQPALPFRSSGTDEPPSSAVGAPTFGPAPASWHPPSSKPPTWSPHGAETAGYPPIPSMVRASKGTIGQQLTRGQWPAAERPLGGAKESLARVSPEAPPSRP
ncbi:MAG: hypothetical protein JNK04_21905, partial [Myxococcales bacterium]|nr:hypothetical protein [Myxococcales bacterium]